MKIPKHKDDWFRQGNFPVDEMELAIADFDEDANAANAPRKEVANIMAAKKEREQVPVEDIQKADGMPEEEEEEKLEKEQQYVTQEEVADVVVNLIKGHEDAFAAIPELLKEVRELSRRVKELEADDAEKLSKQKELVPTASLQSIIAERLLKSNPGGNVNAHPELNRDSKPEETEHEPGTILGNIPFLAQQMRGGRNA